MNIFVQGYSCELSVEG